ncbi:MerR family transcriptional regulator [Saccharothrix sp. NRRL B-16348]|uniref:MerR family transcriptional regulator n=1 Tax=Saccharothrix sp. NRRL B-16348 TaxID=1415542 RepID=UPI0006B06CD7|nr:MerR family transcriptional regulator [Saccharothrix sp. NRRL B-16348]KOX15846.1 MerR family transcriptional regulator [Saccharothrix sp. NRRL B-16348]
MDGGALFPIGELARRTGLTVKAIRFYSDEGIVPPSGRSPAGYRLYGHDAVARLDLVRTLRELDLDLPTIRRVLDRELTLTEVAAAHAEALAARIGVLRLRRAVLTAVVERGAGPEEMGLMHRLAKLSEDGRRQLVDEFLDRAFGDLADDPAFAGIIRSLTPELPEVEQVEAWVELARLTQDPDFRACVRRLAEHHVLARDGLRPDPAAVVRDVAGSAAVAGVEPTSAEAGRVVAAVLARLPHVPVDRLTALVEAANDPRRERYLRLLAVVNGWRAPVSAAPAFDWFLRALGHEPAGVR